MMPCHLPQMACSWPLLLESDICAACMCARAENVVRQLWLIS